MFLSEKRLLELKHQPESRHHGKILSRIFFEEFQNFNRLSPSQLDIMAAVEIFYHRRVDDIWQVKFADGSYLVIERDEHQGYIINCWEDIDASFRHRFADFFEQ